MARHVLHLRSTGALLGAEQVILSLCQHSTRWGYEPFIAVIHDQGEPCPELYSISLRYGVAAYLIECRNRFDFSAVRQLRDLVRSLRIDIVHCHGYREDIYTVLARPPAKLVATNHLWKRTTTALRFYAMLDSFAIRGFDRVIAVSQEIRDELISAGVKPSRLSYIPNGVDVDRFRTATVTSLERIQRKAALDLKPQELILTTIGSLTTEKGHRFLLSAMVEIASSSDSARLFIVGEGPERARLEQLSRDLGVTARVHFLGRRDDIPELLSITDVFILPSLIEGFSIALLEAMAAGVACVATSVGDVTEAIESGTHGILVDAGNAGALASAVTALLEDDQSRARIADNAQQIVFDRFSSERMTKSTCEVYSSLFNQPAQR